MIYVLVILMCVAIVAMHIMNFPDGPKGFVACCKVWLKEKGLGRKTKSLGAR